MWSCALLGFVVSTALVTVCMCISAAFKKPKKLMDTLPHEPKKIDFGFVWDSRALTQTKMSCFETVRNPGELASKTGTVQHFGN